MRASSWVVLLTTLGLLVSSCSGGSSASSGGSSSGNVGGVLRLGTPATIASLNPFTTSNTLAQDTFTNIYPFLVQYNLASLQIEPEFATTWTDVEQWPDLDLPDPFRCQVVGRHPAHCD